MPCSSCVWWTVIASVVLVFWTGAARPGRADDWPQWRGPNRDGIWRETGIVESLPDRLQAMWEAEIGPGYNGPTVADGRVFVMDRQVDGSKQTERVLCFDADNGQLLWQHEYPAPYTISYTAGPRASVTVDGNRAYAVGAMGHFHCLDVTNGNVIWQRNLAEDYKADMPIWGIAGSPLIYGQLVIQQAAGTGGACYVALDKMTGQERWRSLDERAAYSSPIIVQQAGHDVLVCWTGESLSGLDPLTGRVYWSHAMPPTRMPIGIATPAVDGPLVFVSSFYDGSMMIRLSTDSLTSQQVWRARGVDEKNTGVHKLMVNGREVEDPEHTYNVHCMIGTPIVSGGYIYAVDSYGELRCLQADNGRRIWEDTTAVPPARWATIHMVRNGERVWMFNERGELIIATLSPTGLQIIDRAQLIEPTRVQLNRRGGVCWSHPAFAERSVFARNDEKIIRVSLRDE